MSTTALTMSAATDSTCEAQITVPERRSRDEKEPERRRLKVPGPETQEPVSPTSFP